MSEKSLKRNTAIKRIDRASSLSPLYFFSPLVPPSTPPFPAVEVVNNKSPKFFVLFVRGRAGKGPSFDDDEGNFFLRAAGSLGRKRSGEREKGPGMKEVKDES